ncbi:hypothetical protein ACFX13_003452 [Malus domestica]
MLGSVGFEINFFSNFRQQIREQPLVFDLCPFFLVLCPYPSPQSQFLCRMDESSLVMDPSALWDLGFCSRDAARMMNSMNGTESSGGMHCSFDLGDLEEMAKRL